MCEQRGGCVNKEQKGHPSPLRRTLNMLWFEILASLVHTSALTLPRECPDCKGPLMDIGAASLIALERCDTARCVVQTIGDLATTHGYYGADIDEGDRGEALTIADPNEVWMFHITPDDTETSAVLVACRIPDPPCPPPPTRLSSRTIRTSCSPTTSSTSRRATRCWSLLLPNQVRR